VEAVFFTHSLVLIHQIIWCQNSKTANMSLHCRGNVKFEMDLRQFVQGAQILKLQSENNVVVGTGTLGNPSCLVATDVP